jgi:hypothetical protein
MSELFQTITSFFFGSKKVNIEPSKSTLSETNHGKNDILKVVVESQPKEEVLEEVRINIKEEMEEIKKDEINDESWHGKELDRNSSEYFTELDYMSSSISESKNYTLNYFELNEKLNKIDETLNIKKLDSHSLDGNESH